MKFVTETELADILSSWPLPNPRIVASGNAAVPLPLLHVAESALAQFRLFILNSSKGIPVRDGIIHETPFVGVGMRDLPSLEYVPARLSLVPSLFTTTRQPDMAFLHTSMPNGNAVSMGIEVNILPAAIEAVHDRGGLVIAQANHSMPYTYGDGELCLSKVDYLLEVDEPLPTSTQHDVCDTYKQIAVKVCQLIPDEATLQLGIGSLPDAVLASLSDRRKLRVWSEMFSDGVLGLYHTGQLDDSLIIASFCFGSADFYKWVDHNAQVRLLRTEKINDPANIARRPRVISINSALQVDLYAQANASRRPRSQGRRIYSGFGGQTDFIVGALHSEGGKAIIALPSWHEKAGSTVVPVCDGPITSFQQSDIISEWGVADLVGKSQGEQARAIIDNVSHPRIRSKLRESAKDLGLLLTS